MARTLHDHYFKEAKREGYLSRAAYKLIEIDDRKRVLAEGMRVLDLGAAPGSWLQVAAKRVGGNGVVVGVDLQAIRPPAGCPAVCTIEGDACTLPAEALLAPLLARITASKKPTKYDLVLSDMAPATTGDQFGDHHRSMRLCHAILDRAAELLAPGGSLVMKAFEGEAYRDLLTATNARFGAVKGYKPKASRAISCEMFVVAKGFEG